MLYNPEELLVASTSACHMLSYLHLCSVNSVVVLEIESIGGRAGIPSEVGAIVCPNFNTYGAWYDAAKTHFNLVGLAATPQGMDKQMNDLRNQTREIFHDEILLRQYGCSYLPNGTQAVSEGATSDHMALIPNYQFSYSWLPPSSR
jgi:hypothetical protein